MNVYLNQKPDTPAISKEDTIKGSVTSEKNKAGTPKFKKDNEGAEWLVTKEPETSEWTGKFGEMVTYYLEIESKSDVPFEDTKNPEMKTYPKAEPEQMPLSDNDQKQRYIIRQHSQDMAIKMLELQTGADRTEESVKEWTDFFYNDALNPDG